MSTGLVDVVIVAYGNADTIEGCVRSASRQPGVTGVVVVDHGTDGSGDRAALCGTAVVRDAINPGFGAGQNHGAALGASPFVLVLNPDAELVAGSLAGGLEVLLADPRLAAVQGIVRGGDGAPERSAGKELGPIHLLGRALALRRMLDLAPLRGLVRRVPTLADHVDRAPAGVVAVESLAATALLVRRQAYEQVGGFDEAYFLYGEDLDLSRRLRRAGWCLATLPVEWAGHANGTSSASSASRELHWWRGTLQFAATWWSTGAWSLALLAAVVRLGRIAVTTPRLAASAYRALLAEPLGDRRAARALS